MYRPKRAKKVNCHFDESPCLPNISAKTKVDVKILHQSPVFSIRAWKLITGQHKADGEVTESGEYLMKHGYQSGSFSSLTLLRINASCLV